MAKLVKKETKGAVGKVIGPSAKPVEGITEIDFGGAAITPSGRAPSKYPELKGPKIEKLANRILELGEKFDAVADPFKAAKLELVELGFPEFFKENEGKLIAPSSMIAYGTKGGVRVTFKDKFTPGDKEKLQALLGTVEAVMWFRQHWVVKIDGGRIPPEKGGMLVRELKAVMAKFGCEHALQIKAAILPRMGFAEKRHEAFSVAQNLAINEIVPQQAAVSTKGVK